VLELLLPALVPLRLAVPAALDDGEVAGRALLELRPVLVDVPLEPLTPDVPLVLVLVDTPEHGATVAEVNEVALVDEISTPATLQFVGICCSMISTKLIGPALAEVPVVVVVVRVEVPPAEAPPAAPVPEMLELAPAAPDGLELAPVAAPEGLADDPVAAPDGLAEEPVAAPVAPLDDVVVVVDVEVVLGALRISMNATVWPLLLRFMKVPSMGMVELLVPLVEVPLPPEVPVAPLAPAAPVALAKLPLH
jgi:hypothetical protein